VPDEAGESNVVEVPIAYVGLDDAQVVFANQFITQIAGDEAIVTFAQVAPPFLLGEADERRQRAAALPFIPIKVLARYGMPVARLRELGNLIRTQLEAYDARPGGRSRRQRL
jgi:hypothetical protein